MVFPDSLLDYGGRPVARSESRSWLDERYNPERPGMRTPPVKLFIIDSAAQHHMEPDFAPAPAGFVGPFFLCLIPTGAALRA